VVHEGGFTVHAAANAVLIAALRNHAEELIRDARRYRFMLRHIHSLIAVVDEWENTVTLEWGRNYEHRLIAPTIQEAIDAAIAKEQPR
jgi:pantothenate kinase-related protein Tda10